MCWAEPGVGAIASQAFADPAYGAVGMDLLSRGTTPSRVLEALTSIDDKQGFRQVAIVAPDGNAAAHTGTSCVPFAGHHCEPGVSAQGNMLAADDIWIAMVEAYHAATGDLAERLLAALDAAESAGGDVRGQQAAGIRVVAGTPVARSWEGVRLDLRVEDHPSPVAELRRLVEYKRAFDLVARVIFADGLMLGDFVESSPGAVDRAVDDLVEAASMLGENAEPDLWRTVLLARAGRTAEAALARAAALAKNPDLAGFLRRLPQAGFLEADNPIVGGLEP